MLGLSLNHVCKKGPWHAIIFTTQIVYCALKGEQRKLVPCHFSEMKYLIGNSSSKQESWSAPLYELSEQTLCASNIKNLN